MEFRIIKTNYIFIAFLIIFIATTGFSKEISFKSTSDDEMKYIFNLGYQSSSKLYKISLKNGNRKDHLFSITCIIKLYETSYNSGLKIIDSTDAGLAYARRWLLLEKLEKFSEAGKDFAIAKELLEKRYGVMDKKSLRDLIHIINKGII